jgi:MFS family permease
VDKIAHHHIRLKVYAGLCWVYACIHLNRQVFAILAEPIRQDLHFQDQQLGALSASAFSIVYALLGLYFGRYADYADRLKMVRIGAWIWSLAALGAAFAPNYQWLIGTRAGVAVGEAVATAAAVSLMAEVAGARYRARAMSVFVACALTGAGAAAILGGTIVDLADGIMAHTGWRAALFSAGLPGIAGAIFLGRYRFGSHSSAMPMPSQFSRLVAPALIVASLVVVLLQIKLPASIGVPAALGVAACAASWWALRLRRTDPSAYRATLGQRAFCLLLIAFAAVLFVDAAAGFWLFPYAQRTFGVSATIAGAQMGALTVVGGIVGALLGGWSADQWRARSPAGRVWTVLAAVSVEVIAILVALSQPEYRGFVITFALFCVASGAWAGVAGSIGLDVLPQEHRGSGIAAYFFVTTVLGSGLSPFLVGLGSDWYGSLAASIAWCCLVSLVAFVGLVGLGRLLGSRDVSPRSGSLTSTNE